MTADWKGDRIGAAARGENPMVIARMRSGYAVIGDTQFLPGYCVLLPAWHVESLNALPLPARAAFLTDMTLVGDALLRACEPAPTRINYEILGNTDAYLHAHVFPRYAHEPPERRPYPVWLYERERWTAPEFQYSDAAHGPLRTRITAALHVLMEAAYASQ